MPVFSFKSPDLEDEGAMIKVRVYPPTPIIKLYQSKKEKVPFVNVDGLIDTGASCTAFENQIINQLKLIARDKQTVITPNMESEQYLYDIVISLGGYEIGIPIQAFEIDLRKQPYDVLLGRDILKRCTFIYNGWNNSYDLHFHQDIY